MAKDKKTDVDAILAAATSKMAVKAPPTPSSAGNSQFDEEIIMTGPIFSPEQMTKMAIDTKAASEGVSINENNIVPLVSKLQAGMILHKTTDNEKVGKAFNISRNLYKKLKIKTIDNFLALFDEINNNL